jgi:glycosyltransferase involved in cell wall biosynthesis
MKIDILTSDGSPLGISLKDLWGSGSRGIGVGGSEYALLTMCEQWHNDGHEVVLYNNPISPEGNLFEQRKLQQFDPKQSPDVLIVFRSPNPLAIASRAKLKVWWSCDQFTLPHLKFNDFAPFMDKVVVISEYHAEYFEDVYHIHDVEVIDLPVRYQDFENLELKKVPYRMIFTSVPDRGLQHLHAMWPIIKRDIPEAELHITSDYRLWGIPDARNQQHRLNWMRQNGVKFLGAIPRTQLLQEQAEASLLLYPSFYDTAELFCISCAEAQAMGVYPITSDWGALKTTNMGTIISGRADMVPFREAFIDQVKRLCAEPLVLAEEAHKVSAKAYNRFHPETISKQWEMKIFK